MGNLVGFEPLINGFRMKPRMTNDISILLSIELPSVKDFIYISSEIQSSHTIPETPLRTEIYVSQSASDHLFDSLSQTNGSLLTSSSVLQDGISYHSLQFWFTENDDVVACRADMNTRVIPCILDASSV